MEEKYLGKRLDGRYEIQEILGVGGMAVVYRAFDLIENRDVAVKVLKDEYAENQEFVRRFINEARAISVLNHTNIVKVYDASVSETVKYMVMEYIHGITLKEYISQQGSLRWKDTVFFTAQILRALQHAHDKGIVHRDIKPQNIMLLTDGTVKVTDFGIARFARSSQQTITDKAIGSVHYISPEQARGEATDEKSDIYSVGVMMYEMLTGKLPFEADSAVSVAIMQLQDSPKNPTEIDSAIPKGVEQITLRAMLKDSALRYQSAAEMLHDIEDFRRDPEMTFPFSYFVDEAPTRYVDIKNTPKSADLKEKSKQEEEHSVMIPILSGVAAAFLIALVIIGGIFAYSFLGGKTTGHTVVDFRGHKYTDVVANYGNVFTFEMKPEYSNEYEAGIVIAQSKEEGQRVKKTQKIILTVSQGSETVSVPNVIGNTISEAKVTLDKQSLYFEITYSETDKHTPGTIIAVNPDVGQIVNKGTTVKLVVASTPGVPNVTLPSVINSGLSSAKKILEGAGFTIDGDAVPVYSNGYTIEGEKIEMSEGLPEGYVAKQDPDPSLVGEAPKGSPIILYVSNGLNYYGVDITCELNPGIYGNSEVLVVAKSGGVEIYSSEPFVLDSTKTITIPTFETCAYNETVTNKTVDVWVYAGGTGTKYHSYNVNYVNGTVTIVD